MSGIFSRTTILVTLLPAAICVLVTGCPHNEYTIELKPDGSGMERTLTFYRADGSDSNGVPNYQSFPSNELAAITAVYPVNAVTQAGQRYVARGEFAGALAQRRRGRRLLRTSVTSLRKFGILSGTISGERRSRCQDDETTSGSGSNNRSGHRLGAGRNSGTRRDYEKLHQFLDKDFRQDIKNAAMPCYRLRTRRNTHSREPGQQVGHDRSAAALDGQLAERLGHRAVGEQRAGGLADHDLAGARPWSPGGRRRSPRRPSR